MPRPPKTGAQLLAETRARVKEIDAAELKGRLAKGGVTLLDIRDPNEANLGMIPGALHVSRGRMESNIEAMMPRDAQVVVYCANGNRSVFAAETLDAMGYEDVVSLAGGINAWVDAGGDVE